MLNILFIIDPLENLLLNVDTSFSVMGACTERGHHVYECQITDLVIENGEPAAYVRPIKVWARGEQRFEKGETKKIRLDEMQVIFMRKDAPFDMQYLTATFVLSRVDTKKTFILNTPHAIRNYNEKLLVQEFPQYCPPTLLTSQKTAIREFVAQEGTAIIKPLFDFGGKGICILKEDDPNMNAIIELVTKHGKESVIAQKYLKEAREGDIRVVTLNDKCIGAENRISNGSDHRNNISSGGRLAKAELTPYQKKMCDDVAAKLPALGIYCAGLDVIGNYLTEINITSPTGVPTINALEGSYLEPLFVDFFENYENFLTH